MHRHGGQFIAGLADRGRQPLAFAAKNNAAIPSERRRGSHRPSLCGCAPTQWKPARRNSTKAPASDIGSTTARPNTVPIETRTARRKYGCALVSPTSNACAPNAAAFRTTPPRFSAFATASTATKNRGRVARASAISKATGSGMRAQAR
jgi:hypothetical protein